MLSTGNANQVVDDQVSFQGIGGRARARTAADIPAARTQQPNLAHDGSPFAGHLQSIADLRQLLAELGTRLVQDHGFRPASLIGTSVQDRSAEPLVRFLIWLDQTPEALNVLRELGIAIDRPHRLDLSAFNRSSDPPTIATRGQNPDGTARPGDRSKPRRTQVVREGLSS